MALPRTFVSFSSSDIGSYHMMCSWKGYEHIDFHFNDLQLEEAIDSTNEHYIKRVCRAKLNRAGTCILLILGDERRAIPWLALSFVSQAPCGDLC